MFKKTPQPCALFYVYTMLNSRNPIPNVATGFYEVH